MITKSWHCIFVDPYLHIWSFQLNGWVFLGVRSLPLNRSVIHRILKEPREWVEENLLFTTIADSWQTNFTSYGSNGSSGWTIADSWQTNFRSFSITESLLLRSIDDKSSWRHLVVFSLKLIIFWSLLWSSSDHLLIMVSDHLKGGDTVLAVAPAGRLGPVDPAQRLDRGVHV